MGLELFGERMKQIRKASGKTQKDFAKMLNLSAATLSAYENNDKKPSTETLYAIADTCKVSLDWLCGRTEYQSRQSSLDFYSDCFLVIDKLYSTFPDSFSFEYQEDIEEFINPITEMIDHRADITANLHVNNDVLVKFLRKYQKMTDLLKEHTIDENIFKSWLSGELKKGKFSANATANFNDDNFSFECEDYLTEGSDA